GRGRWGGSDSQNREKRVVTEATNVSKRKRGTEEEGLKLPTGVGEGGAEDFGPGPGPGPQHVLSQVAVAKRARIGVRVGKEVLVSDGMAAVLTGVVSAIEDGQARVHYKGGRKRKMDEWIEITSAR
ncbi:unnamed protein product, partial [Discosporangium mesarthrocarpum]